MRGWRVLFFSFLLFPPKGNVLTYLEEEVFALCEALTEETVAEALSMQARCSVEPGRCEAGAEGSWGGGRWGESLTWLRGWSPPSHLGTAGAGAAVSALPRKSAVRSTPPPSPTPQGTSKEVNDRQAKQILQNIKIKRTGVLSQCCFQMEIDST